MKERLKDNYKIDLNHTLIAGAEVEEDAAKVSVEQADILIKELRKSKED